MRSAVHQTVRAWDGSYYVPHVTAEQAGKVGRLVGLFLLAAGLVYCGSVAYDVIQSLRAVKLIDLRMVLERVSVGDAILTWLAYVLGRELLRFGAARERL